MIRTIAKTIAAAGISCAILTLGPTAPAAAQPGSGSGTDMVQSGSSTGSVGVDLPTAVLLCELTGGDYVIGASMPNIQTGCYGGLFGKPRYLD
ncbi:hypothetical protein [Nocardia mangyaensis]|uniref:hypothetical protein n=1 Tax=Nocardia mangyaensis TaxID=2213200 RepID=UPI0026762572|nr:hypothetical protein [Nocardia mangyaensis]MDO3648804.1 hypothetical protein [Nocardia mangyaensis]